MVSKWTVYALTFASYAMFHSIRSAWAGMKNMFFDPPFQYSIDFLGLMDMIVVFTLALSLTVFGSRVQLYGAKKCLIIGMTLLAILTLIIGILLIVEVTYKSVYIILFGIGVGLLSATGWPSCLYLLSQYFDRRNNTSLPIWNGTSQFGDFLALFISDIVIEAISADAAITLLIIPIIMSVILILNVCFLPQDKKIELMPKDAHELNQQKTGDEKKSNLNYQAKSSKQQSVQNNIEVKDILVQVKSQQGAQQQFRQQGQQNKQSQHDKSSNTKQNSVQMNEATLQISEPDTRPVNFSNVWCLPGVALYVTAYSIIKSINSIIMTWLVFYLSLPEMEMKDQSRIIAILWTLGVFGGGVIGGKVNSNYSKIKFIICMAISAVMFLTLQKMHQKIYQIQIAIAIVFCSLAYGIPYNMLSTAVPIMLGENEQIKNRPGAKSAIISLMQGFGQGVCGFSILLVPLIGIDYIHYVLMVYCLIGISILAFALYFQKPLKNVPTDSNTQRQNQKGC